MTKKETQQKKEPIMRKDGYEVVKDKNGNPKGIALPTDPEQVDDPVDKAFAEIFSKYL